MGTAIVCMEEERRRGKEGGGVLRERGRGRGGLVWVEEIGFFSGYSNF